jgi:hypothetical protein
MLSERMLSYHPDESVTVDVDDQFRQLDTLFLPDTVDFLDDATLSMLHILTDALITYHNAPVIVLRTNTRMERKRQMMSYSEELTTYLDQSKLRYNHLYGVRMAIDAILYSIRSSDHAKARRLEKILRELDLAFYINGNDPNDYPDWHIDDQLQLALEINPGLEKAIRNIEKLCL